MKDVLVLKTGIANLASIVAGLRRAGARAYFSDDPDEIHAAAHVVLPGVGAFKAGMDVLAQSRLIEPLQKRFAENKATLAVCLGLQLLCTQSEEDPGIAGLGLIDQKVRLFPNTLRVPQLGWNMVKPVAESKMLSPGYAYFANSYRLVEKPPGWMAAFTDYGGSFVAAMERGSWLACQFHPELSGPWGAELIGRWLQKENALC